MNVAQVSGENHHASPCASAAALPPEQNPAGHRMAEIMETNMAPSVRGFHVMRQTNKHTVNRAVVQPRPALRNKEGLGLRETASPLPGIVT